MSRTELDSTDSSKFLIDKKILTDHALTRRCQSLFLNNFDYSRGDWCRLPYGCPVRWCVQVGPLGHALHSSTAACTSTTTMHEFQGPGYCCVLYVLIDAACCVMYVLIDACCVLIKIHTLLCAGRFARIRWRPICRYMRHSRQHFQLAAPCDGPRSS